MDAVRRAGRGIRTGLEDPLPKGLGPECAANLWMTPLHRVARLGNAQLVETLLSTAPRWSAADDEGALASHYAEERLPLVQGDEKSSALLTATLTVRQWEEGGLERAVGGERAESVEAEHVAGRRGDNTLTTERVELQRYRREN